MPGDTWWNDVTPPVTPTAPASTPAQGTQKPKLSTGSQTSTGVSPWQSFLNFLGLGNPAPAPSLTNYSGWTVPAGIRPANYSPAFGYTPALNYTPAEQPVVPVTGNALLDSWWRNYGGPIPVNPGSPRPTNLPTNLQTNPKAQGRRIQTTSAQAGLPPTTLFSPRPQANVAGPVLSPTSPAPSTGGPGDTWWYDANIMQPMADAGGFGSYYGGWGGGGGGGGRSYSSKNKDLGLYNWTFGQ